MCDISSWRKQYWSNPQHRNFSPRKQRSSTQNSTRDPASPKTKSLKLNKLSIYSTRKEMAPWTREVHIITTSVDLKAALDSLGFEAQNQTIYQMISDLDADGNGNIVFEDFLHLMTSRVSDKDSRENIKKVFNLFDDEKTGFISIKNLRRIVRELGENIEEHELQEMIDKADLDHDGMISEEEFYLILTKKGPSAHWYVWSL